MKSNIKSEILDDIFIINHSKHNTITSMEGLRGFAAFLVFLVHYAAQSKPWVEVNSFTSDLIFNLRFLGATGVELFFIISGFLIYGMLINKEVAYLKYAKRRIKRIYPTFLVLLTIYVALNFLFPSESKIPPGLYDGAIFLLQNVLLLPGIFDIEPLITVSWTLSYEMFFYLSVPLIIHLFNMRNWSVKYRVALILLASITIIAINLNNEFFIKMTLFLSGMIVYEMYSAGKNFSWNNSLIILPLTFALMLILRHHFYFDYAVPVTFTMFILYGLICLDVFHGKSQLGAFFKVNYMRWFGNMSYSYYLMHGITLKFLFLVLAQFVQPNQLDTWVFYSLFIPFFAITAISSALLFIFVEKPMSLQRSK